MQNFVVWCKILYLVVEYIFVPDRKSAVSGKIKLLNYMDNKTPIHPKYRVAELLRKKYGELNTRQGISDLTKHCNLRSERTVQEWMRAEAGSTFEISHFVINQVLTFFELQKTSQLITPQHKDLLKQSEKTIV